jgi:C4-type Zn-finger protein
MKIIREEENIELSKRFYTGYKFVDACPKCGIEVVKANSYLSYPFTNQATHLNFSCDKCYHEWQQWVIIKLEIIDANAEE